VPPPSFLSHFGEVRGNLRAISDPSVPRKLDPFFPQALFLWSSAAHLPPEPKDDFGYDRKFVKLKIL
jgi:hypothetical protein